MACGAALLIALSLVTFSATASSRSFVLHNGTLLRDGKPWRVIAASVHYFRVPSVLWEERIRTVAASGVNALQTYIAWNVHCPDGPDVCTFGGDANFSHFLRLAQQAGLDVLLRPGPYICAEWDFGGFPAWFERDVHSRPKVRTSDPVYVAMVKRWWSQLLPMLQPLLYRNGGPVAMVQVENEYGAFGDDHAYLAFLRDMLQRYLGRDTLLYSTDIPQAEYLRNSATPEVYQVVDFFAPDAEPEWAVQRTTMGTITPVGPPFNDEFYPGWLTHWFDPVVATRRVSDVLSAFSSIMFTSSNASSVNFYVFFGGTNFAFMAGQHCITSYDYGAPVNESGHVTPMFGRLTESIAGLPHARPAVMPPPQPPPLRDYGTAQWNRTACIADAPTLDAIATSTAQYPGPRPPWMERLNQSYGYVAYSTKVDVAVTSLELQPFDYVLVYADGVFRGAIISGKNDSMSIDPPLEAGGELLLIIENMGRSNWFPGGAEFRKGLLGEVALNSHTSVCQNFTVRTLPMTPSVLRRIPWRRACPSRPQQGTFFSGSLMLSDVTGSSLLDMRAFGKGFVVVNGHNLGRYWTLAGPQRSLFIPAPYLREGRNDVVVFEQALWWPTAPPPLHFSAINYNVM